MQEPFQTHSATNELQNHAAKSAEFIWAKLLGKAVESRLEGSSDDGPRCAHLLGQDR